MRPITDYEYQRMRNQAEARLVGMSEIGFILQAQIPGTDYPDFDDPITGTWIETGFQCDFVMPQFSRRESSGSGLWTEEAFWDSAPATARLPMRYVHERAFTVREDNAWKGQKFDITQKVEIGSITEATVIPPTVIGVVLMTYNNMTPGAIRKFDIVSVPRINADTFDIALVGTANAENITLSDDYTFKGFPNGYGYLGAVGGSLTMIYSATGFNFKRNTNGTSARPKLTGSVAIGGNKYSLR